MSIRDKISLPHLILEFLSVVFAVLLALGLNSYKESADLENRAEVMKASIINECQKNKVKIDSMMIQNRNYYSLLDSLVRLERVAVSSVPFQLEFDQLTDAAWVIAQNDNSTNLLGQDFLIEAAELYQQQEFYMQFITTFISDLGNHALVQESTPPYDLAMSLYFSMNVLFSTSEALTDGYDDFLTKYVPQEN